MNTKFPIPKEMVFASLIVVVCWIGSPARIAAQCTGSTTCGYNAVFNSSGTVTPSMTFVDASVAAFAASDICTQIYNALSFAQNQSPPSTGVVIDARGITSNPGSCGTNSTPWTQPTKPNITIPSTVLLPPGRINISTTWILPGRTRIVGLGKTQTTIAAITGFAPANSTMIQ